MFQRPEPQAEEPGARTRGLGAQDAAEGGRGGESGGGGGAAPCTLHTCTLQVLAGLDVTLASVGEVLPLPHPVLRSVAGSRIAKCWSLQTAV